MTNYRILSNYTELSTASKLADAKEAAITESLKFDDVVTIQKDMGILYVAQYGRLYRATPTR